jgi:hypothetical protein
MCQVRRHAGGGGHPESQLAPCPAGSRLKAPAMSSIPAALALARGNPDTAAKCAYNLTLFVLWAARLLDLEEAEAAESRAAKFESAPSGSGGGGGGGGIDPTPLHT